MNIAYLLTEQLCLLDGFRFCFRRGYNAKYDVPGPGAELGWTVATTSQAMAGAVAGASAATEVPLAQQLSKEYRSLTQKEGKEVAHEAEACQQEPHEEEEEAAPAPALPVQCMAGPLPARTSAPCRQETAAALLRLKEALQHQRQQRHAAALAAAAAAAQEHAAVAAQACAAGAAALSRDVYLAYNRRYSNPHYGSPELGDGAEECHVIVQASTSTADSGLCSSTGSASLEASDSESEPLAGEGSGCSSGSWAGTALEQQLEVLTVIPNASFRR